MEKELNNLVQVLNKAVLKGGLDLNEVNVALTAINSLTQYFKDEQLSKKPTTKKVPVTK